MSSSHAPNSEAGSSSRTSGTQEFPNAARYRPIKTDATAIRSRADSGMGMLSERFAIAIALFSLSETKLPVACVSRAAKSHIA